LAKSAARDPTKQQTTHHERADQQNSQHDPPEFSASRLARFERSHQAHEWIDLLLHG
jgi:hypothetical protein